MAVYIITYLVHSVVCGACVPVLLLSKALWVRTLALALILASTFAFIFLNYDLVPRH